jgi:tetratricopeptide (TPR) repeat protein
VHPIASGRESLLPAVFAVGALAAWLRGGVGGRLLGTLAFAAALFGRESAIAVAPLLLLADALRLTPDPPRRSLRRWLAAALPLAAVVALYLAVRSAVLPPGHTAGLLALVPGHLAEHGAVPLLALAYALQSVFVPYVAEVYEPSFAAWWSPLRLAAGLTMAAALAWAAARLPRRDRPAALYWALWFPASMALTLNFLPQETPFAERFLLLPVLGVAALMALVASRAASSPVRRRVLIGAALLGVGVLASISASRARFFRDELSFAAQWVRADPGRAHAHLVLGTALLRAGRVAEALTPLREAVRLDPKLEAAHYNLGGALALQRRDAEALAELRLALALHPRSADTHEALAAVLERTGQPAEAAAHRREARHLRGEAPAP